MTGRIKPAAAVDTEADYRAAWKEFDPSFNGSITASQLRQIMAGLGEVATDVEVDGLMNSVDGDQKISCKLILSVWKSSKRRTVTDCDGHEDREFVEFAKRKSGDV
jgi:calmodulin